MYAQTRIKWTNATNVLSMGCLSQKHDVSNFNVALYEWCWKNKIFYCMKIASFNSSSVSTPGTNNYRGLLPENTSHILLVIMQTAKKTKPRYQYSRKFWLYLGALLQSKRKGLSKIIRRLDISIQVPIIAFSIEIVKGMWQCWKTSQTLHTTRSTVP